MKQEKENHWGNVRQYWTKPSSRIPRIIITQHFGKALILNLLIIGLVCKGIPYIFRRIAEHSMHLAHQEGSPQWEQQSLDKFDTLRRTFWLVAFSHVWAVFQAKFLFLTLLSNPGYYPLEARLQLSDQQMLQKLGTFCEKCRIKMDNTVFHCAICDICCRGFSHHCHFLGKCIGQGNSYYLKAYFYGFLVGIPIMIVLFILSLTS